MSAAFDIVVSSENTPYIAWQTQLFCYSAMSVLNKYPIVVVHRTPLPLQSQFQRLSQLGFPVIFAPSYRTHSTGPFPPRNELGTLLTIAKHPKLFSNGILLCEPDMLFAGAVELNGVLSGEYYSYLHYEERRVVNVLNKLGLGDIADKLNRVASIGVPYFIPTGQLSVIASRWIEVLDSFDEVEWIDIMYAFGIALEIEGYVATVTTLMSDNFRQQERLSRPIVHYCYGDDTWSKRSFLSDDALSSMEDVISGCGEGSILAEILKQIREAKRFYYDEVKTARTGPIYLSVKQ